MSHREWRKLADAIGLSLEQVMAMSGIEVLRHTRRAIEARPGRRFVSQRLFVNRGTWRHE